MSLIFNPTSGVAYLETEEAVPWASLGGRAYTHFVLLETTVSQANSQYAWSTGNYQAANALNMWFAPNGDLTASAGPATAERAATATSPAFGGGLLRLAVIRGIGVQNSNSDVDYQSINLGTLPGSSSVQISSSPIQKYTTGGSNSFGATKLTLGDRQTTPGYRKFFGTMHFAGSVNRALDDNELIAILQGDIPVLDYFKHNLVELWDFQRSDASALTGLISGTTFKMFGGSNLTWGQSAPLPVSKTRGHTILGATNRSVLAPVWTYGESSGGSETINCTPAAIGTEGQAAGVLASEVLQTGSGTLSVGAVSASIVELATIGCTATALSVGGEPCAIHQQQAINCTAADTAVSGQQASIVEAGQDTIACTAAAVSLAAAAAQQVEAGSSTINCTSGALSVTAPAAGMVEAGDSVIGCVSAPLSVGAHAAALIEAGSSIVNCTVGALSVTAPPAGIIEVGDSIIGCSTAALSLSSSQAAVVESGTSVIGCAAASLSISGTTASITDSMGVRTAAVVLDTPGCSIHDFDIIGASSTDLSIGSSVAGMVEVGEAVIGTGYADIGITTTPCALITTDAEPIITNIGLVASINQPSIFASIPNITITAKV